MIAEWRAPGGGAHPLEEHIVTAPVDWRSSGAATPVRGWRRLVPYSLASRLIAGAVLLSVVLLVVPASLAYVRVKRDLLSRLDDQLIAASRGSVGPVLRQPDVGEPAPQTIWMTQLGDGGTVLDSLPTGGPIRHMSLSTVDRARLARGQPSPVTVRTVDGESLRVISEPVPTLAGTVVVGLSTDSVQGPLHRLLLLELLLGLGAAGVAAAAAVGIRYSLWPLRRLTTTAQLVAADISTHGAGSDRRAPLGAAHAHTETGELTSAFNTLLDVVETEFRARSVTEQQMRQFLADASHELRTPLTSIQGYAELENMRRRATCDGEATDSLARIQAEGNRMAQLIDELLTLARADQHAPVIQESVDLTALAREAVELTRTAHPDREIVAAVDGGLATRGDYAQLLRVIRNLLTNAAIHSDPAGSIRLDARRYPDSVIVSVSDDGPGMRPDQAQRAFERFWRADQSRVRQTGGTGLGLAIVQSTIAAHGGTVELRTDVDVGTTVTLHIPEAQSDH
jgi:two-component system, OmpR family, sensor kinase